MRFAKLPTGRSFRPMLACLAATACCVVGCSTAVPASYDDPTPEAQLGAIRATSESGNRADIPRLVECLYSDDDAVRLAAIQALKRLTGTTLEYRATAPPAERARTIESWKTWVREHGIDPRPQPASVR
ncbi:MAG: HEAT repeat domain-containing protein [Phycisphaerae bacterium]|nr:HEAT repeat domain-containing protein [Phycisphaerae bacterium]